jgi:putative transposase
MIHAERCQSTAQFLLKAQQWQDTWNCYRPSYGINMHGRTPKEKLIASKTMIQNHVIQFPVLLMDYVLKSIGTFTASLKFLKAGKYVHTKCLSWKGTSQLSKTETLADFRKLLSMLI